jgi:pilus assembly protein Flp/PilA
MLEHFLKLSRDEDAATAVEYAVMLALVLVVIISAINAVGNTSSNLWASDTNQISAACAS